jgi:hypothetical protein
MNFQIGRATFPVSAANLTGQLSPDGRLRWELQVFGDEGQIDGETWYPWACIQDLNLPSPADGRWQTCFPFSTRWTEDAFSKGMISIGGSCFGIYSGVLQIGAPDEDGIMRLDWEGVTDLGFNEEFSTRVPIKIQAPLKFVGINVGEWSMEGAETVIKRTFPQSTIQAVCDEAVAPLVHFELL